PPEMTIVVHTTKNVTAPDLLANMSNKCTDSKAGSYTMYTASNNQFCFAVVDKRTVVYSADGKTLRAVLERNGKPQLATAFQETLNDLEYNHHFGAVCNLKSLRTIQQGQRDLIGNTGPDAAQVFEKFEKAVTE